MINRKGMDRAGDRWVRLLAMVAIAYTIGSQSSALGCDTWVALPDATADHS